MTSTQKSSKVISQLIYTIVGFWVLFRIVGSFWISGSGLDTMYIYESSGSVQILGLVTNAQSRPVSSIQMFSLDNGTRVMTHDVEYIFLFICSNFKM